MAQHGADGAVHVGDLRGEGHPRAVVDGLAALRDELLVERLVQAVLHAGAVQVLVHERRLGNARIDDRSSLPAFSGSVRERLFVSSAST